ncbi:MAG: DUF4091 domain-containing protein [Ruminococcaceae bacterium]|nr:DUF4091 domain-containing protein [Oscillospiraceae bacterium]
MKKIIALILAVVTVLCSCLAFGANAVSEDPSDSYVHIDAPNEDSGISLWFDYASEKISPDVTESTGMETFSVYMAKNEIENAQFVLAADGARDGMTAALSGFVNEAGDTLSAEIFIELYHDCDNYGMVPDAIPPLAAHGPFSLTAGKSQAFLVKITSDIDAVAGWYSSDLNILNADGNIVKTTKIFVYVWDFALSEETACATSIGLAQGYLNGVCASDGLDNATRYKYYYDYLLENRVNAMYLPYQLHEAGVIEYLDNPRVNSFQVQSDMSGIKIDYTQRARVLRQLFGKEEYAHRFDKMYYFAGALNDYKNVLDPLRPDQLETLKTAYDNEMTPFINNQPSYSSKPINFLCTYFADIDYTLSDGTVIDQIDYYDDFVNLLCSKPFAYTDASELSTPGAKVMQDAKWDAVYGTFKERMAEYKADGNKVWWFLSWDVEAPYINYYMQTDGVAQRLLFWQQYDNGVEGFLYNFANFWIGDCADPYNNNVTNGSYPNAHGESILIYPGSAYGLTTPVGSLRLEAMRDGIEDYQLFSMLDAKREGASAAIIDKMTTGMVTYSTDDGAYYETRIALGNAVEAAEKGECAHDYVLAPESTEATCTEDGVSVYICVYCSDEYTETVKAPGHSFEDGRCTVCGEADPDWSDTPDYTPGDVNGDGEVNAMDMNVAKRIIAGTVTPTAEQVLAGDLSGDGVFNGVDSNYLARLISGTN